MSLSYFKGISVFMLFLFVSFTVLGQSKIAGKVIDKVTGEDVIGATVTVKDANAGAATDLEGRFLVSVPPGTYTLLIEYLGYSTLELPNVVVVANETANIDAVMEEASEQLQEVVVQAESPVRETTNAILVQQKNAVAMVTGISAEQFRRMPDRTTSDVLKRVSGASIQENRFAIIRGLNDRYNMAMLNGAPMPSTESDRKAFSFDIVPSNLLDNVMIVKTATPDMPADFAGGFIQINTRDIPDENIRFITVGGGFHSLTTFKGFYKSSTSSKTDFLGFDNGTRQIPEGAMTTEQASKNTDVKTAVDQTRLFNHNFASKFTSSAMPNYSLQAGLSQRVRLFNNPLGIIVAVTHNKNLRYSPFSNNNPLIGNNEVFDKNKQDGSYLNYENYRTSINSGLLLNAAYRLGLKNKISFKNLYTINSDDQTIFRTGDVFLDAHQTHSKPNDRSFWYQSSRMLSSQFNVDRITDKIKIRLNVGRTNIMREIPDYKRLLYTSEKPQGFTEFLSSQALIQSQSAAFTPFTSGRFSSDLDENMWSANGSVAIPFNFIFKSEIKVGGFYQDRIRTFDARNYVYAYNENLFSDFNIFKFGPDSIFKGENFAPDKIFQKETTSPQDSYSASSKLKAGYAMLDNRFTEQLRIIWGVRLENFNQKLNSSFLNEKVAVDRTWNDFLPSGNLIFSINDASNLRASYSKTLSRPEFREFAPLQFLDFNLNGVVVGNPALTRAIIHNFDLKYEIYPGVGNVFSLTPFYKKFTDPVEAAVQPNASNRSFTYLNAKSAQNFGLEVELRLSLAKAGALIKTKVLDNFSVYANYAAIRSKVDLTGTDADKLGSRPLQGQSPFVFNGGVQYSDVARKFDVTFAANRIGRRIAFVSNERYQLIWESSRTVLDFSVSKVFFKKLTARFIVGDMLAKSQPLIYYQDTNNNNRYDAGTDVESFKYRYGFTSTVSLGYSF